MYLVAGLGVTGQSVLQYFASQGEPCFAYDARADLDVSALQIRFPQAEFATGRLPSHWCERIETLVLSPGIAKAEPWVQAILQAGKEVIGDIELFARAAGKPIVAITGSNGKSTVTTLVGEALQVGGYRVGVGGNIGRPALDLLADPTEFDVYVLELSSFQLETTYSLHSAASTVLNICEDHMDRYSALEDYIQAKMTILNDTELAVLPDGFQPSGIASPLETVRFGLKTAQPGQALPSRYYGVMIRNNQAWLGWEDHPCVAVAVMAQSGRHHQLNALAMMALCRPFQLPDAAFEKVLRDFNGLPHRTQLVLEANGVQWINDSKGTNVGATITAMESMALMTEGEVILLAGGVGKDADFTELGKAVARFGSQVILFGRDRLQMAAVMPPHQVSVVATLEAAIALAATNVRAGDKVLFSPACASFDQFENYQHRGEVFEALVRARFGSDKGGAE